MVSSEDRAWRPTRVASERKETIVFAPFFLFAAFTTIDDTSPTTPLLPVTATRMSIVARNMDKKETIGATTVDSSLFVAEQQVAQMVASGLGIKNTRLLPAGTSSTLCANDATDYVLTVEASLGKGYILRRSTPPTFPGAVPQILTPTDVAPQINAVLSKCPGTTLASSFITAPAILMTAASSGVGERFSSITQLVSDPIIKGAYSVVNSELNR
jgi:hypothetical protein